MRGKGREGGRDETHDFAEKNYVLATHEEQTSWNVTVPVPNEDSLYCIL